MKKIILFATSLICIMATVSSCKDQDTYADKLKKESNAIKKFIKTNDIDVLDDFPADSIFRDKQYYKDQNTGVYFAIKDWGEGTIDDSIRIGENAYLRYDGMNKLLVSNDTLLSNSDIPDTWIEIQYGDITTYSIKPSSGSTNIDLYYRMPLLSPGSIIPLKYGVRHKGVVSLIIPFSSGSYTQQSKYEPMYVEQLTYRFK